MVRLHALPRLPEDFVSRARIDARLAGPSALAVVRGAQGWAAAAVVADWLPRSTADVAVWFPVGADTAVAADFWSALDDQLVDARVVHPAGQEDPRGWRRLLRLLPALHSTLVLVIAGAERITEESVFAEVVDLLLHSPRVRVIAVTSAPTPFEAAPVAAEVDVDVITPADLRMTPDEVGAALLKQGVDDARITTALHSATGGMPALVRLLAREPVPPIDAGLHEHYARLGATLLREWYPDEVLGDAAVDLLVACSVCAVITEELAELLTGRTDMDVALGAVKRLGLGWWTDATPTHPMYFAVVPALCLAVQGGATARSNGVHAGPIHDERVRVAVEWCLEHGFETEALITALRAGDLALANNVARRGWTALVEEHARRDEQGRRGELLRLVEHVPALALPRFPLLALVIAVNVNAVPGRRRRAIELFVAVAIGSRLPANGVPPSERVVLRVIESAAFRVGGRGAAALAAADRAAQLLTALGEEDRAALGRTEASLRAQLGLTFFYAGQVTRALDEFSAGLAVVEPGSTSRRRHLLALTAGLRAYSGELEAAQTALSGFEALARDAEDRTSYTGALARFADGVLALERGDYESADAQVESLRRHFDTIEHWPTLMALRAHARLGLGKARETLAEFDPVLRTEAHAPIGPRALADFDAVRALLVGSRGRLAPALALLDRHPASTPSIAISRARLHLAAGGAEAALRSLAELGDAPLLLRHHLDRACLTSAARLRLGQRELAAQGFEQALVTAAENGLRTSLTLIPRADLIELVGLCPEVAALPNVHALYRSIIAERPLLPELRNVVALTERERVVLEELAMTEGAAEIAERLKVSVNTVKSQLRSIYRKLDVTSRDAALRAAAHHGLLGD